MTDDEDDSTDENFSEPTNLIHEHYNYMAARENMQEFSGRVPQRKRKKESENPQQDSNKPKVRMRPRKINFAVLESIHPLSENKPLNGKRKEKNFHNFSPQAQFHEPHSRQQSCVIYFVIIIII